MPPYANRGGNSGIVSYETGLGWITVTFKDGSSYLYTDGSTGAARIARMKELAAAGQGLNSYISTTIKTAYERKLR